MRNRSRDRLGDFQKKPVDLCQTREKLEPSLFWKWIKLWGQWSSQVYAVYINHPFSLLLESLSLPNDCGKIPLLSDSDWFSVQFWRTLLEIADCQKNMKDKHISDAHVEFFLINDRWLSAALLKIILIVLQTWLWEEIYRMHSWNT